MVNDWGRPGGVAAEQNVVLVSIASGGWAGAAGRQAPQRQRCQVVPAEGPLRDARSSRGLLGALLQVAPDA